MMLEPPIGEVVAKTESRFGLVVLAYALISALGASGALAGIAYGSSPAPTPILGGSIPPITTTGAASGLIGTPDYNEVRFVDSNGTADTFTMTFGFTGHGLCAQMDR